MIQTTSLNNSITKKHLIDLSKRSYSRNQYTFSDFLTMAELSDFYSLTVLPQSHEDALSPCGYKVYGGYDNAERAVVRFGSEGDLGYEEDFPIACIEIAPLMKKFADDLKHPDFLGSLMNLGIERSLLGDIVVKDNACYVFALEKIAPLICSELTRVKHTSVIAKIVDTPGVLCKPEIEYGQIQAKSRRVDGFVAKICNLSRQASAELFVRGLVFVNGREMSNESYQLKDGDVVSVRGHGRFIFVEEAGVTKKGNINIRYGRFI